MQYQVPQFLEIEDKIVGPLSIRQFLYIAGGAGAVYLSIKLLPIYFAIFPGGILGGLAFCLAFVKINNKPFIEIMQAAFVYVINARMYIWRRVEKKSAGDLDLSSFTSTHKYDGLTMKATSTKLSNLAWQVDTGDKSAVEAKGPIR